MYKALRPFKYQTASGEIKITVPGQSIPEASGWKNLKIFLERRWICKEGEEPNRRHYSAKVPKTAPTVKAVPKTSPVKVATKVATKVSTEPVVRKKDKETREATPRKHTSRDLESMSKKELQSLAKSLDVDPHQPKADLVASVLAAQ